MAVARIWRGATRREDRERYLAYLERTGFSEYRATEGNLGVLGLWRDGEERTEFLLVSLWESMDAVRAFAGPDPGRAVFYPEDERFLVRADPGVEHWNVGYIDGQTDAGAAGPDPWPDDDPRERGWRIVGLR